MEGESPSSAPATAVPAEKRKPSYLRLLVLLGVPALLLGGGLAIYRGTGAGAPAEAIGDCLVKAKAISITTDTQAMAKISEPKGGSVEFKGQNVRSALANALSDDAIREGINACRAHYVPGSSPLQAPTLIVTATIARANQIRIPGAEITGNAGPERFACSRPTDQNGQCDLVLTQVHRQGSVRVEAFRDGLFLARAEPTMEQLLKTGVVDLVRDASAEPVLVEVAARDCNGGPFHGVVEVAAGTGFVWDAQRDTPPLKTGEGRKLTTDKVGHARFNAILASLPESLGVTLDPNDSREPVTMPLARSAFHDTVPLTYPCPPPVPPPPVPRPLSDCNSTDVQLVANQVAAMRLPPPPIGKRQTIDIRGIIGDGGELREPKVTGKGKTAEEVAEVKALADWLQQLPPLPLESCKLHFTSH